MTTNYTMGHYKARANKQAALECGETTYLGSACPHLHSGVRYVVSGNCVECTRVLSEKSKYGTFVPEEVDGYKIRWPWGREAGKHHGSAFYNPLGKTPGDPEERCKYKHEGLYRTSDGRCMSCFKRNKRLRNGNKRFANRNRYIPVWLRD